MKTVEPTNEPDETTITIVLEIISIDDVNITEATPDETQKHHKPITRAQTIETKLSNKIKANNKKHTINKFYI